MALTSDEPAETIVRAADGVCAEERGALSDAVRAGREAADANAMVDRVTQVYWRAALADVIAARAGARQAEPPQRPTQEKQPKETPL
jgi:hypothetical protein